MATDPRPQPEGGPSGTALRILSRWAPAGAIVGAACIMLAWTWGAWADPIVDFGLQLYTAWQLAEGKVLYRDVAFYNGPLSQYVNSLWFRLFGVGLRTLVWCNLAIAAALVLLLRAVLRRVAGRAAAAAGCLIFVLLFLVGDFTRTSNYNYVCPYSHEMTHGVALSLLSLLCVWGYRRWGLAALACGGLALGLVFLTKAEIFVAAAAGTGAALAMTLWAQRPRPALGLAMAGTFLAAALAPPVIAMALLSSAMPASAALAGTLGSWTVATRPGLTGQPFYQDLTGLATARGSLLIILVYTGLYAAVLVPAGFVAWFLPRWTRRGEDARQTPLPPGEVRPSGRGEGPRVRVWVHGPSANHPVRGPHLALKGPPLPPGEGLGAAAVVFFATAGLLGLVIAPVATAWQQWDVALLPLPLFLLAAVGVLVARFLRRSTGAEDRWRAMRQASLVVLALVMMSKMILAVWIGHYGFVLAMPATMVLVVLLLDWLPAAVKRMGGEGLVVSAAGAGMIAAAVAAMLFVQARRLAGRTVEVAPGTPDAMRCGAVGSQVNDFVADFRSRAAPGQTLAVVPEGALLNYLCRRESSVPYVNFLPLETALYGEQTILEAMKAHPPDWIAFTNRKTDEYELDWFTRDYGGEIGEWMMLHYLPARTIGGPVLQDQGFGILLLKRVH
jgi:hypothetical protein